MRSGLIADPSIQEVVLQVADEFVLLATDGYWDVVSPDNAVVFVSNMLQRKKDPALICSELTQMATLRGTCDNCTVMLLTLKQRPFAPLAIASAAVMEAAAVAAAAEAEDEQATAAVAAKEALGGPNATPSRESFSRSATDGEREEKRRRTSE